MKVRYEKCYKSIDVLTTFVSTECSLDLYALLFLVKQLNINLLRGAHKYLKNY